MGTKMHVSDNYKKHELVKVNMSYLCIPVNIWVSESRNVRLPLCSTCTPPSGRDRVREVDCGNSMSLPREITRFSKAGDVRKQEDAGKWV